jgi:DNA-binding XRE family transcriptional regulator
MPGFRSARVKVIAFLVPAISDYEIRRELLRAEKTKGLARLDGLRSVVGYIPLTSEALLCGCRLEGNIGRNMRLTPKRDETLTAFGRNVAKFRNERDFSQDKLAEGANLDRIYLSGIERGVRIPGSKW